VKREISLFHPAVAPACLERVRRVLAGRWIGQGTLIDEFERALRDRLGLGHLVVVNNAASALRLALAIAGVGPGDEVVTTAMTCTMTNHPILEQFARPVFADIQEQTGNLDPADVARRLTDRTRAIVCAHWGGTPCDLDELGRLAAERGLVVIEDASEALGATYRGTPIGNLSRFTAFSFQAIQVLTTGEGGALAMRRAEDADEARTRRWFGIDRRSRRPDDAGYFDFDITRMGFGYHATNIAAAIGLGNLEALEAGLAHRRGVAERYRAGLAGVAGLRLPPEPLDRGPSHHVFTIHVERRADFVRRMKERGIETSIVHARNDQYAVFGGRRPDLPNLDRFERTYLCLPTHPGLTPEDVAYVIESVRQGW
jgi:perosamine synthetase